MWPGDHTTHHNRECLGSSSAASEGGKANGCHNLQVLFVVPFCPLRDMWIELSAYSDSTKTNETFWYVHGKFFSDINKGAYSK